MVFCKKPGTYFILVIHCEYRIKVMVKLSFQIETFVQTSPQNQAWGGKSGVLHFSNLLDSNMLASLNRLSSVCALHSYFINFWTCWSSDIILKCSKIVSSFPREVQPSVGGNWLQVMYLAVGKQVRMLICSLGVFTVLRPGQQWSFVYTTVWFSCYCGAESGEIEWKVSFFL